MVHKIAVSDIIEGKARLPFVSRSSWRANQMEDPDLRQVHAYLSQGIRLTKKMTDIKDIKQ